MLYSLEYFFIPSLVDKSNQNEFTLEGTILLDAMDSFQMAFGKDFPEQARMFNWDEIVIKKKMTDCYEYWFFEFPIPTCEPEARWGIVVHLKNQPFKYITFELAANNHYVLGGMLDGAHLNYGIFNTEVSADEFIKMALSIANK